MSFQRCCDECLVVVLNLIFVRCAASNHQHGQFCNGCAVSNCGSFGARVPIVANFPTSVWVESLTVMLVTLLVQ